MGVKRALDILEPFESTLEREIRELKKRSEVFQINDDDPRFVIENKIIEKKHLQQIEQQAALLKIAIKELRSETSQKKSRKRKSPLALRGY